MVYVWRQGKGSGFKTGHRGRWVGPRIVLGEDRGNFGVSLNNQIIKAAPEQIRPVTEEERLAALHVDNIMKLFENNMGFPPTRGFIDVSSDRVLGIRPRGWIAKSKGTVETRSGVRAM